MNAYIYICTCNEICVYTYVYIHIHINTYMFQYRPYYNLSKFESKKPVLVNGNLRLNFKGRVGTYIYKHFCMMFLNSYTYIH
jgi:hypothetical protein